jgi:hypothetical protein
MAIRAPMESPLTERPFSEVTRSDDDSGSIFFDPNEKWRHGAT